MAKPLRLYLPLILFLTKLALMLAPSIQEENGEDPAVAESELFTEAKEVLGKLETGEQEELQKEQVAA